MLFEAGAAGKIPELVAKFGARTILLVTDRGVRAAGLTYEGIGRPSPNGPGDGDGDGHAAGEG